MLAVAVWRVDARSLRRLRVYEGVLLGVVMTYSAWEHYSSFFVTTAWFPQYAERHPSEISVLARHPSITWLVIIVAYGTFIPNTGRRCATVTPTRRCPS